MPLDLTFDQKINVEPALVYRSFTRATDLREFMCNVATVEPKPGGRIYLAWEAGYYFMGHYTHLEENKSLGFTWLGKGDPGPTQVDIQLEADGQGTKVSLTHSGLEEGEVWQNAECEFAKGWTQVLENLASVLETGEDQRFVRRPMMGIFWGDLNADIAKELGVPTHTGVRLGGVGDGMSAQKAEMQKDDVLVELDGKPLTGWSDLTPILQRRRAGDVVTVVYYRGAERKTVDMALAARPMPAIPWDLKELAAVIERNHANNISQLDQVFQGMSEAEASFKPAPTEWSVNEGLAHLVLGEHWNQFWIMELVSGHERWADGFGDNEPAQINATLAAYPTFTDMVTELKRTYLATIALVAGLPGEFPQTRKASYWRMAYNFLQPDYHLGEHLDQIKTVLQAARK